MNMKQILKNAAITLAALAIPATAFAQAPIEGRWRNPHGSVVVRVSPCGNAYCATVIRASDKQKAKAHNAGNAMIGAQILRNIRPRADGTFSAQGFDPKSNIRAPVTVRVVSPNVLAVRGCAIAGALLCREQTWNRVS